MRNRVQSDRLSNYPDAALSQLESNGIKSIRPELIVGDMVYLSYTWLPMEVDHGPALFVYG